MSEPLPRTFKQACGIIQGRAARPPDGTLVGYVHACSRCGRDHPKLHFWPLTNPNDQWTHWALCPTLGEPLRLLVFANEGDKTWFARHYGHVKMHIEGTQELTTGEAYP
jgi:hypothetical protein